MQKKLLKIEENDIFENYIECKNLTNNTLILKYSANIGDIIKVTDDQEICIIEKGILLDKVSKTGYYKIIENNVNEIETIEHTQIRKTEKEELCIIFINISEIKNNKYFIKKPIEYIDWTYKDEPLITKIKGEGIFDFQIVDSSKFLNTLVIGLRNHYSRQELIEQIRNHIVNSIKLGIKEVSDEYKVNINDICESSKTADIKLSINKYDEKLLEKGIKITFFNIQKLEIADGKVLKIEENEIKFEESTRCENCGNILEKEDSFCKVCGTLNICN